MSNSFVFYESFHQAIRLLPERERLQAYEAVCNYALFGEEPEEMLLPGTEVAFILIKPQIDANNQRRSNGGLGGRPRKEKPSDDDKKTDGLENEKPMVSKTKNQRLSESKTNGGQNKKPNVNVNVNDNVNVNANVNENVNVNDIYSRVFEDLWKIYPRKKEKAAAYKAYKARLNNNFSEEQMLTATKRYAEECRILKTEERYIKHGSTFFGPSMPFADYLAEDWKPPENSRKQQANGFHNFDQREYDFDELQKRWGG